MNRSCHAEIHAVVIANAMQKNVSMSPAFINSTDIFQISEVANNDKVLLSSNALCIIFLGFLATFRWKIKKTLAIENTKKFSSWFSTTLIYEGQAVFLTYITSGVLKASANTRMHIAVSISVLWNISCSSIRETMSYTKHKIYLMICVKFKSALLSIQSKSGSTKIWTKIFTSIPLCSWLGLRFFWALHHEIEFRVVTSVPSSNNPVLYEVAWGPKREHHQRVIHI